MTSIIHSSLQQHHNKFLHKDSTLILDQSHNVLCLHNNPIQYIHSIDQVPLHQVQSIQYAEDATLLRLYHDHTHWITSTRHTIDAQESHYASKHSFDSLFWDVWNTHQWNTDILHKHHTYFFLLIHPQHQHIIKHTHKKLILIDIQSQHPDHHIHQYPFHSPQEVSLDSYQELSHKRGLIFLTPSIKYLLDFPLFTAHKKLRGNTPSLLFRFLQLYKQPSKQAAFVAAFPHFSYTKADSFLRTRLDPKKHSPKHLMNLLC